MIRTYEQEIIERFAAHSRVPVINGLTNEFHPCQILADLYTYLEHRGQVGAAGVDLSVLKGKVVAFGGRALMPDQQPKYFNSPETALFEGGRFDE